jgi:hypothetical protein
LVEILDDRFIKIIAGLALQNAIYNKRNYKKVLNLYSDPNIKKIKELYDRLIISKEHKDREIAFLLEPGINQDTTTKVDSRDLVVELRQIEVILYDLLWRVGSDQRDFNDWLNYVANAAQSIQDKYWIESKILTSLAYKSSMRESVEEVKRKIPELRYKIEILQNATVNCYEKIRQVPSILKLPEERYDTIITVQETLIHLLKNILREKEAINLVRYLIQKLSTIQRFLMRSDLEVEKAKKEVLIALDYLEATRNYDYSRKINEVIIEVTKGTKATLKEIEKISCDI